MFGKHARVVIEIISGISLSAFAINAISEIIGYIDPEKGQNMSQAFGIIINVIVVLTIALVMVMYIYYRVKDGKSATNERITLESMHDELIQMNERIDKLDEKITKSGSSSSQTLESHHSDDCNGKNTHQDKTGDI